MTAHSPDFDTVLAHGASHRYAGGAGAVIRVMTGATLTLTSGYVTFDYPDAPREPYACPLRRGVLPETPPVPPGWYPVHLIVADITRQDRKPPSPWSSCSNTSAVASSGAITGPPKYKGSEGDDT